MRALHWPSAWVHDSKNAPHPQEAVDGPTQAVLAIEVVRPEWPRCSARKRLKRFSPFQTIRPR